MKKPLRDLKRTATVEDLDELGAQIIIAITKALEEHPTKEDLKKEIGRVEQKVDSLEKKVDKLGYDVSDIRRRVIDLEGDTVSRKDMSDLKYLVATHQHASR